MYKGQGISAKKGKCSGNIVLLLVPKSKRVKCQEIYSVKTLGPFSEDDKLRV